MAKQGKLVFEDGVLNLYWIRGSGKCKPAEVDFGAFADPEDKRRFADDPGWFDNKNATFKLADHGTRPCEVVVEHTAQEQAHRDAARARRRETALHDLYVKRQTEREKDREDCQVRTGFHNPYTFVPAPPRRLGDANQLGDARPVPHGRYADDRWSGVLEVEMTTVTPLLLREVFHEDVLAGDRVHRHYSVPTFEDGTPDLHPTMIKGMLSAAYEAATNSRLRVFDERKPLTRRMAQGESVTPVRVVATRGGGLTVQEVTWLRLPRYPGGDYTPVTYQDGSFPKHGDMVTVTTDGDGAAPVVQSIERGWANDAEHGWVVVTGRPQNDCSKIHESVFVEPHGAARHQIDPDLAAQLAIRWRVVIDDYVEAHRTRAGIMTDNAPHTNESYGDLFAQASTAGGKPGLLCWASGPPEAPDCFVPTRFGRASFPRSPYDALDPSVRPARSLDELSPADRVFGWVIDHGTGTDEDNAHRGQLRVDGVKCVDSPGDNPIEDAAAVLQGCPARLAPLSSPKPSQAAFYAAADEIGTALPHGTEKGTKTSTADATAFRADRTGAGNGATIRGRKVYPSRNRSQAFSPLQWLDPRHASTDSQNATLRSWVKADCRFTFTLRVTNLSDAELGGLLWLLRLNEPPQSADKPPDPIHRFRLGGGRPFGFGEVALRLKRARVRTGAELREALLSAEDRASPSASRALLAEQLGALEDAFIKAARSLSFEKLENNDLPDHLRMLKASLRGFTDGEPVHYPRLAEDEAGEIYAWFSRNRQGGRHTLPDVIDGLLPYTP